MWTHSEYDYENRRVETNAVRFEESLLENFPVYFDAQTVLELFDYFIEKGKTETAFRLIEYGADAHPNEPAMLCRRALALMELDRHVEAFVCIERALDVIPEDEEVWVVRAQILDRTGNHEQALQTLQRGLAFLGHSPAINFELGLIFQTRGMYEEALPHFRAALECGAVEEAYAELILCYEELEKAEECLQWLEARADQNPFDAAAWYHYGLALTKNERYEQAINAFQNAIAIEDDNFAHHYALALALVEMKRYSHAVPALLDALLLCPDEKTILMFLGECYEELAQPALARVYYMRCKKHHPSYPEAWYGIGSTFESEGKYLECVYYYEKALELDENFYDALLGLAACEYELGNEVSAMEALEKAIAYMPEDVLLWDEWAGRLEEDGRLADAYAFVKRGLAYNPGSPELIYRLAALAFKLNRVAESLAAFESALLVFFDGHEQFFEMCPEAADKPVYRAMVARYRD